MQEAGAESGSRKWCQKPQTVSITPTRVSANQFYEQGCKFVMGSMIKNCVAYGGTSMGSQLGKLQNGCNILVATPGCLLGIVEQGSKSFENVEYFVLDKADLMLDMGFGLQQQQSYDAHLVKMPD